MTLAEAAQGGGGVGGGEVSSGGFGGQRGVDQFQLGGVAGDDYGQANSRGRQSLGGMRGGPASGPGSGSGSGSGAGPKSLSSLLGDVVPSAPTFVPGARRGVGSAATPVPFATEHSSAALSSAFEQLDRQLTELMREKTSLSEENEK